MDFLDLLSDDVTDVTWRVVFNWLARTVGAFLDRLEAGGEDDDALGMVEMVDRLDISCG